MSRTRYHDFRQEDSTELFNNRFRGIFDHGVYAGFNLDVGTSSGLYLDFNHDVDPDDPAKVLGVIVTPDGVIIQENEDQADVVLGSLSAGTPNVHYVIASYSYNKALPNNDVVYTIRQGTAGTPPIPPALTKEEVLLGTIDVPSGATAYNSVGVRIKSIAKKDLFDITDFSFFQRFDGILHAGIYEGIECSRGSGDNKVTMSTGTWVTKQKIKITESSTLSDMFTIAPMPSSGNYKFIWIVGAHKHEEISPYPDPDYMLVHGADAAVGTQATLPSDTQILISAQAVNAKYSIQDELNKLGILRIENRAGTYYIEYIKGKTMLDDETIVVYGAKPESMNRSGKYFGYSGLVQAITDVYTISKAMTRVPERPFNILLDGEFKTDDYELRVPSNIAIKGYGASAKLWSEYALPLSIRGWDCAWDSVNAVVVVTAGTSTPPTGYVAKKFEIQATYRIGDEPEVARFSRGDRVRLYSTGTGDTYEGIYVKKTALWTFEAFVTTDYQTAGNPTDLDIAVIKRNSSIENLEVAGINTGIGRVEITDAENVRLADVVVGQLYVKAIRNCHWGHVTVKNAISAWTGYCNSVWDGRYNIFDHFTLLDSANAATIQIGVGTWKDTFHVFEYDNPIHASIGTTLRLEFPGLECGHLRMNAYGVGVSLVGLYYDDQSYQQITAPACKVQTGNGRRIFCGYMHCSNLEMQANGLDTLFVFVNAPNGIINTCTNPKNRVLFSTSDALQNINTLFHGSEDRNLKLVSLANLTWNSVTGVLSWDAPLKLDVPWQTGYIQVNAGSATLGTDGDRLYLDIDREATGTSVVSASTHTKATATVDRFRNNRVFLAVRDQGVIYLFNGTRIENTQTVKVGSTPPPDNSVSYIKLSADAVQFHNEYFRDYVSVNHETNANRSSLVVTPPYPVWPNGFVQHNPGGVLTFTYTTATGVIQYSGPIDLSQVVPGDLLVLASNSIDDTSTWNREEILSVDDLNNRVTIRSGLLLTVGAASVWNGSICRGAVMCDNVTSSTTSYDPATGRVTFTPALGFTQYMVQPGYVFVDRDGKRFAIKSRDTTTGSWVNIGYDRRDVSVGSPLGTDQIMIEVNNNPERNNFADLKVSSGVEFIPIDWWGHQAPVDGEDLVLGLGTGSSWPMQETRQRMCSEPYDPRVRVWTRSLNSAKQSPGEAVGDGDDIAYVQAGPQGFVAVEFNGPCSGVAIAYDCGGNVSSDDSMFVDGYRMNGNPVSWKGQEDLANTYDNGSTPVRHHNYFWTTHPGVLRMPFGVHHVMFMIPESATGGAVVPWAIRGLMVFTAPGYSADNVAESPGRLIRKGGYNDISGPTISALPTCSESYNKGGRVVRYVGTDNVRHWATNWVRGFTDTGNVSNGSGDITSVANPTRWRKGDLIMLINGSSRTLHVITNIAGTTISVTPTVLFTLSGCTLRYYGHTWSQNSSAYNRPTEAASAAFTLMEFACGGDSSNHRGPAISQFSDVRTNPIGVRLSDLETILEGSAGFANAPDASDAMRGFDLLKWPNNGILRFRFVGTGFAINIVNSTDIQIQIDGMVVNAATLPSWLTRSNNEVGGTYIVGELPYGTHMVNLVDSSGAANAKCGNVTIFQPKKPTIPAGAFELFDANVLAQSDTQLGISVITGVNQINLGTVNQEAAASCHYFRENCVNDVGRSFNAAIGSRDHRWSAGGAPVNSSYDFVFVGTEFTMNWDGLALAGANPILVYLLDNDNAFHQPGSTMGFVSTGATSISSTPGTGHRDVWTVSKPGVHVIRFSIGQTGDQVNMNSIETQPRLHVMRSKAPWGFEHYMPWQWTGHDVRNQVPFPAHQLPAVSYGGHTQSFTEGAFVTVTFEAANPFFFYSPGGLMEIGVFGLVNFNQGVAPTVKILMDCSEINARGIKCRDAGALATGYAAYTQRIYVKPGFHWLTMRTDDSFTGDEHYGTRWFARFLGPVSPNAAPNRSLGQRHMGPGNYNERLY